MGGCVQEQYRPPYNIALKKKWGNKSEEDPKQMKKKPKKKKWKQNNNNNHSNHWSAREVGRPGRLRLAMGYLAWRSSPQACDMLSTISCRSSSSFLPIKSSQRLVSWAICVSHWPFLTSNMLSFLSSSQRLLTGTGAGREITLRERHHPRGHTNKTLNM